MPESELASVILETERLRLRPMVPGDAASLHSCYGDPQAMQYWDFAVSRDLAHTTARLTDSLATDPRWHRGWGVIHKVSEDFVGYVNYHNRDPWHRRLAVGYILARPYWGQGLMTEALLVFLAYCFEALETHRIEAAIEPGNTRSLAMIERLGFQREGVLRDRLSVGGSYRSVVVFSLLDEEWRSATTARGRSA
jgi:ribosomal-protein-alanine N-acetyltransferase